MQIDLTEKTLSLFGNTEVGDYVRYPRGRLCLVVPRFIAQNRLYNAVMLSNGLPVFFAADEKVEVFINVKFKE